MLIDTSGGDRGFTIYLQDSKIYYKLISKDAEWLLKTDVTTERWQDIVMTWHKFKGLSVYVNGAFKDSVAAGKKRKDTSTHSTSRLMIGRESKAKGPFAFTRFVRLLHSLSRSNTYLFYVSLIFITGLCRTHSITPTAVS